MDEDIQQLRTNANGELMSDEDFIRTIESMSIEAQEKEINSLLKAMHENRIVSWDEAERILQETDRTPIKCSLPEQTRPTEPDNEVDVDTCIRKLLDNDPTLKEVNLNNMKRTPVPAIKRLLEALAYNEHCERISLANMGLYDHDIMVLVTVIEMNKAIKKVNLETNYLSGDFFAKLFNAALTNETVEEIKAVNQGVSFSTQAEKEIIDAIVKNHGLTKISINFRLPEGRHKVENATLRNGEIKRMKRREAALKAKQEQQAKEPEKLEEPPIPKPEPKKEQPKKAVPSFTPKYMVSPEPKPASSAPIRPVVATAKPKPTILAKQLSYQRASRESEEETELVSKEPTPSVKKVEIPRKFIDVVNRNATKADDVENEKPKVVPRRKLKEWKPTKVDDDEDEPATNRHSMVEKPKKRIIDWNPRSVDNNDEEIPKKPVKTANGRNESREKPRKKIIEWNPKSIDVEEKKPTAPEKPIRKIKDWNPKTIEDSQERPVSPEKPKRKLKDWTPKTIDGSQQDRSISPEKPRRKLKEWNPIPIEPTEEPNLPPVKPKRTLKPSKTMDPEPRPVTPEKPRRKLKDFTPKTVDNNEERPTSPEKPKRRIIDWKPDTSEHSTLKPLEKPKKKIIDWKPKTFDDSNDEIIPPPKPRRKTEEVKFRKNDQAEARRNIQSWNPPADDSPQRPVSQLHWRRSAVENAEVARAPVSAKDLWAQRMAKMERKEEKKKSAKPLLSIQQIREMERRENEKNENRNVQKIKAKKINPILNDNEKQTTIIRQKIRRRQDEQSNNYEQSILENRHQIVH